MSQNEVEAYLDDLTRKFLCSHSVKSTPWNEGLNNWTAQQLLISKTVHSVRNVAFPVRKSYQKTFLKWLINNLEARSADVHDSVYNALGNLVTQADIDAKCYKHYTCESDVVSLCESVQLISEGTTGLNTWQAALVLSEWSLANKSFFRHKTILELGSGLGLVGLSIALGCRAARVVLTDCHDKVLERLKENVALNLQLSKNRIVESDRRPECILEGCIRRDDETSTLISVVRHFWGENDRELVERVDADVLLAADVVYDSSLFPALVKCVNCALDRRTKVGDKPELVLVCTERNSETLAEFLQLLKKGCEVIEETLPEQKCFVWSTDTPIRLFKVTGK